MFEIKYHVGVFWLLLLIIYLKYWLGAYYDDHDIKWYIPFLAAVFVMVFLELFAWSFYYFFTC